MVKKLLFLVSLFFNGVVYAQSADELFIKRLSDEIMTHSSAYDNLRVLTKTIGARLAGSPQMTAAEDWGFNLLKKSGSDSTFKQPCWVPHWVRGGQDIATALLSGNKKRSLEIVALGNTVGTGLKGLTAPILLIHSFDELEAKKEEAKGKIVFYNYKFNPRFIETFNAYGDAVKYRGSKGITTAAKYGAVATIVRSMSHSTDNFPHTGATSYDDAYPKRPAVAIGLRDADWLAEALIKNPKMNLYLKTNGHFLPDAKGYNIIGELKGTTFPDEYIVAGGHLDSWDICEGAHDDGAGIVQTIEILRAFKALGYQPIRTLRFVLYANEENGARGALKYAESAAENKEKHIFAIESDAGGFTPRGFHFDVSKEQFQKLKQWQPLLVPYGADRFLNNGGSGVDISFLKSKNPGIALAGLAPDSQRYFDIHHARNDVFESVNKRELDLGALNMAALIYLVDTYGL